MLISNKLIQPDKQKHYLNYRKLIILKKGDEKEHFKVKGKIIEEMRNYCKVIIMSIKIKSISCRKEKFVTSQRLY